MRVCFDLGGVCSKYPKEFREIINCFISGKSEVFVITDMHDKSEVVKMLKDNGFVDIPEKNIYCADYKTHGEFCKAILLRDLKIDLFFDDFIGYCEWDSTFGPAPIRCLVMPDGFKPYWAKEWKVDCESDFGRRVFKGKKYE